MAIRSTTTPYGPPALSSLATAIAHHKQGDPLAPVTVIVPTNYAGVAARRALGRDGLAAVTFLTCYRLAERLGASRVAAGGRRPVSTPIVAGAVRTALRDEPGHFEGVETHPATERALVRAHRELSEVDEAGLRRLAGSSDRAAAVVRLHRRVDHLLDGRFSDEQDLAAAAIEAIAQRSPGVAELGPVILYLPQELTSTQVGLLTALGSVVVVEVIVGLTGAADADEAVRQTVARLGCDVEPRDDLAPGTPARACSVSDADDEVRHAVREIVNAARDGIHLSRCAVLYGSPEPYARLVADALEAAGLPWFGRSVRTAEDSLLGRTLLGLLALGDHDLSRRDVSAWLSAAPIRDGNNRPAPVAAWERLARAAGVVAGRDQWRDRLARHAADLEQEAAELERSEEHRWRAERNRRDASRARELAEFIARLATDLDGGARMQSWSELARWCRGIVRSYLGGEPLRRDWPVDEQRAADRVEAAIDRLGELDGIDPHPSALAFRRALTSELATDLGRHSSFGAGVLVGPVGLGVGLELERVVLLGLAEGTFPARRRDDPLLPDHERQLVGTDLPPRANRIGADHRDLMAVLAAASESVMMFPRGDLRRAADRAPSRWLLDSVEQRDGVRPSTETLIRDSGSWFDEVPSFVAGMRRCGFPAHAQEYDVLALLADREAGLDPAANPLLEERPEVRLAVRLLEGRGSRAFTRYDGNLATDGNLRGVRLPSPTDRDVVVSATRLEAWAECPHAYFVRYVLGVDPVEAPDREYRMSPLIRGELVHRALDSWLSEAIAAGAVPRPDQRWSPEWRARLLEVGREECDRIQARGLAGRHLYWQHDRRRVLADLDQTLAFDDEQRRRGGVGPIATELRFGMPGGDHQPVTVPLPDGRTIRIRGSVDRVDSDGSDQLVIIDYKTGKSAKFRDLSADDPAPGGGHLQLVLYGTAARSVLAVEPASLRGAYWFVSSAGKFIDRGYEITAAVEHDVLSIVAAISDGIAGGLYPLRPVEPRWRMWVPCWYCDPDGLGTRDQWREWDRKRDEPAMRPYLDIAEPDLLHHVGSADG